MIVIPTGTDAPIYHRPYATVALIVVNIALLFVVPPPSLSSRFDERGEEVEAPAEVSNFERYALTLGDGKLHPMQWVTHNFLHDGIGHLLGNVIFLWAFGIVVEGKLGVVKYLLAYLAIGTLHGALAQLLLMRSALDGHAAGASAVVYGLLAVCMVWAPRNELNCMVIFWIGFRVFVREWDLYFTTVALWYIGEQVVGLIFWGSIQNRVMVTEMGHLSGAFWGSVVAVVLLKTNLVDCEGWDVFSLLAKRRRLAGEWKTRGERIEHVNKSLKENLKAQARARKSGTSPDTGNGDGPSPEDRARAAVLRIKNLIDKGDVPGALLAYDRSARTLVNWPPQADLHALIKSLHSCGAEADSVRLLRDHCRYYPDASTRVGLKLAQILIRDRQRPAEALRVLGALPSSPLPADLEAVRRKLTRQANALCEEGVLELEGDD